MPPALSEDRVLGAFLGAAVGDALGMPVDGLSHQNVRLFYRGIKGYTADEKRGDLGAGQWTAHTQRAFALTRAITSAWDGPEAVASAFARELEQGGPLRRPYRAGAAPTVAAAAAGAPLGLWRALRADWYSAGEDELIEFALTALRPLTTNAEAITAAVGAAFGVALLLRSAQIGPPRSFVDSITAVTGSVELYLGSPPRVGRRLQLLKPHLDDFPLDLQDRCNGTGDAADEAFPFAVAMFARNPTLVEATLLSAINVGGAASAVGAMTGALLGALNGWRAFPAAWREGLEGAPQLEAEARALYEALRA
ncbi:MAG TPA: ADP-ribosylglycohydrolase family protein [Rubricoccaceae bacterium]|nr:ADP-ribosylglycohydrolase family protein [Rubricoccaceae bacterium]